MVDSKFCIHIFVGQDSAAKDDLLKQLKGELLARHTQEFNLDLFYAKEVTLPILQERLKALPVNAKNRMVVVKSAHNLKKEIKDFILRYVKSPDAGVILVLDIESNKSEDGFVEHIAQAPNCRVHRFKEAPRALDAFALSRYIDQKQTQSALGVLSQLLKDGEKPERILGGLRYSCQRNIYQPSDKIRRLRMLLRCDLEIKTGRLKPNFALEKLIVGLCGLAQSYA